MGLVAYIGVQENVIFNVLLMLIHTKPLYVALLGFAITISLVLTVLYAWKYSAKRRGRSNV